MKYLFPYFRSVLGIGGMAKIFHFPLWALMIMYLFCGIIAYLLGSINTAIIVSKKIYGYDIREYGSGNAGMTNMFRTFGKKAGFITLGGDAAKSIIALVIAYFLGGDTAQYVAGFFVILGHIFPIYYHFKGGKGVIAGAMTVLFIDPIIFIALIILFGLMFAATRIISASSITAAFFYPLVVFAFNKSDPSMTYILFSILIAMLIIAMHKDNIIRLKNGEEKKFEIKKDKDKKDKKNGK